jgi:hypothetical protein
MEQSNAVNFYKKGRGIGFTISPICIPETDKEGNKTGKMECLEHSHTPEDLTVMLTDMKAVLEKHGFETTVFGTLDSMQKSLTKKLGRVQHSDEALLDFAFKYSYKGKSTAEELAEWKAKYYAEGGR